MGLGDDPTGDSPCGFDLLSITPATAVAAPEALYFDPLLRDVPIDDAGHYVGIHPVDAKFLMALGISIEAIPSAPGVGGTLSTLPIDDANIMTAEANRRVQLAVSDLIDAGDVRIVSVVAYAPNNYRAHVDVTYQNLRLPSPETQERTKTILLGGG